MVLAVYPPLRGGRGRFYTEQIQNYEHNNLFLFVFRLFGIIFFKNLIAEVILEFLVAPLKTDLKFAFST